MPLPTADVQRLQTKRPNHKKVKGSYHPNEKNNASDSQQPTLRKKTRLNGKCHKMNIFEDPKKAAIFLLALMIFTILLSCCKDHLK
jgi:hypothetical protein